MRTAIIITIIFLVLTLGLIGIGFYGYQNHWFDSYLKKEQGQLVYNYTNYSFLILDSETQEKIGVDFKLFKLENIWTCLEGDSLKLYLDNKAAFEVNHGNVIEREGQQCYVERIKYVNYKEGKFLASFNQLTLQADQKYSLFTYSDNYYTGQIIFYVNNIDNQKTIFESWHKPLINLSFKDLSTFVSNSVYISNLSIDVKHQLRNIVVCTEWTFGIINVELVNYFEEIPVPARLKRADSCYLLGKSLTNDALQVPMTIKTGDLTLADYFTIYVIDTERFWNGADWKESTEDLDKNDIGASDYQKNFSLSFVIR